MIEVIMRARGAAVKNQLWERLHKSEQEWIMANIGDEEWHKLGPIEVWKRLRGVSDERAALDIGLKCDLLSPEKHAWLLREIGAEEEDLPAAVRSAVQSSPLVLTERPRALFWQGQEIEVDWERLRIPWDYLWRLARAAKHRGSINDKDFELSTQPRNLVDWKHRLLEQEGFPQGIGDLIDVEKGNHRLNLSPQMIRLFENVPPDGPKEITY
jgi:hypothetical protein